MDKRKKNIVLLCIFGVLLSISIVLVVLNFRNKKKMDNLIIGNDYNDGGAIDNNSGNINTDENGGNLNSNLDSSVIDNDIKDNDSTEKIYNNHQESYTEEDVVSYFDNMEREVTDNRNWNNVKEKFKGYFIKVVDFIFYDEEVNGYTFSKLTNIAKLKVISVALKIDNKIEEYIPGYKETISSASNRVYANIKERLVTLYMDISTKVCENNSNECEKAKEIFTDIKDTCKIGWSFIKELASSGFAKLKEWYEIYSGK